MTLPNSQCRSGSGRRRLDSRRADRNTDAALADLLDWLHTRSLEGWDMPALLSEVVEKLDAHRVPLSRVHMGMPILHPLGYGDS